MLPITFSIADSFAGNKIGMNCNYYLFSKVLLLVFSMSILFNVALTYLWWRHYQKGDYPQTIKNVKKLAKPGLK